MNVSQCDFFYKRTFDTDFIYTYKFNFVPLFKYFYYLFLI